MRDGGTTNASAGAAWRARIALGGALLVMLSPVAHAKDLEVPSERYPSLRKALRKAKKGDVIRLAPGDYTLRKFNLRRKNVTLEGDGATIRLRRSGKPIKVRGKGDVIRGVRFESTPMRMRGDGAVLEDCSFAGTFAEPVVRLEGDESRLVGCRFEEVLLQDPTRAMVSVEGTSVVVRDSVVHLDGSAGVVVFIGVQVSGEGADIDGNEFTSRRGGMDEAVRIGGTRTWVRNNQFTGMRGLAVMHRAGNARIEANRVTAHAGWSIFFSRIGTVQVLDNVLETTGVVGGTLIEVRGGLAEVSRNDISGLGSEATGIRVSGDGGVVNGNTIAALDPANGADDGIVLIGDDGEAADNVTSGVRAGVRVEGDGNRVVRHTGDRSTRYCVDVVGLDNEVLDCTSRTAGVAAFSIVGTDNRVADCRSLGAETGTDPAPSAGFRVFGDGNTLIDCTARNALHDGFVVTGDNNRVERVTVDATPRHGVSVDGTANFVLDSEVLAAGVVGFRVTSGSGHRLLRCTSRSAATGFHVRGFATDASLEACVSDGATDDGLLNEGSASTVVDSTFVRSGSLDIRSPELPLEARGNTFGTGGFPTE